MYLSAEKSAEECGWRTEEIFEATIYPHITIILMTTCVSWWSFGLWLSSFIHLFFLVFYALLVRRQPLFSWEEPSSSAGKPTTICRLYPTQRAPQPELDLNSHWPRCWEILAAKHCAVALADCSTELYTVTVLPCPRHGLFHTGVQ